MPDMIQAQIMQNHSIPIRTQQLPGNMPRNIIIDFGKVLQSARSEKKDHRTKNPKSIESPNLRRGPATTYRNKETARPIRTREEVWEQLQPRVVAVHDELAPIPGFQLCEPGILRRERGRGVALSEVEDHVEERGDRARGHGFDAGHGDGWGGGVGREREGGAVADETGRVSFFYYNSTHLLLEKVGGEVGHTSAQSASRSPPRTQNRSAAHPQP